MNVGSMAIVVDARWAVELAAGIDGDGWAGRDTGGGEEGGNDNELMALISFVYYIVVVPAKR